jgi:hypothetical protein
MRLVLAFMALGTPMFAGTYWGIIGAVHGGVDTLKSQIGAQERSAEPTVVVATDTPVLSPTASPSATPSATQSPTFSVSPTSTDSPTESPSFTASPTPSATPTLTASATASDTYTGSPTSSATPSATDTSSATLTSTVTSTFTPTSTITPTATATPTPQVQLIWQNGTAACWGGNCATGGITIQDKVFWSTYTTVSNAMEWYVTVGGFNYFEPAFTLQNAQDQSAYAGGHLQFDVKLGQPASNYSAITIFAMGVGGSNMSLDLASVNNSSFTTVSFPLATLGTNGTGLMSTEIHFTSVQNPGAVMIYFNNIQWVSN